MKKSQSKVLGPDLGDAKWSTASFRSRVGQLNALAFLDDLLAKNFSSTSLVRAVSRLIWTRSIFEISLRTSVETSLDAARTSACATAHYLETGSLLMFAVTPF